MSLSAQLSEKFDINDSVVVFSKANCPACNATISNLNNVDFKLIKIDETGGDKYIEFLRANKLLQMPVVITKSDNWTGFRPDKIMSIK
jgi:glutaredoxin-like protein NrdH